MYLFLYNCFCFIRRANGVPGVSDMVGNYTAVSNYIRLKFICQCADFVSQIWVVNLHAHTSKIYPLNPNTAMLTHYCCQYNNFKVYYPNFLNAVD